MRDLTHITADTDLTTLSDADLWPASFHAQMGEFYEGTNTPEQRRLAPLWDHLNAETVRRVGEDGAERIADWLTGNHASLEDAATWAETNLDHLLAVAAGEVTR